MTRKHFETIASTIQAVANDTDNWEPGVELTPQAAGRQTLHKLAIRMSLELQQHNQSFDRQRFLTACGFGDTRYPV